MRFKGECGKINKNKRKKDRIKQGTKMNNNYTVEKKDGKKIVSIRNFPTLFKYQPINEYSIKALVHGEIWGTVPTHFNDPYDMIFCYSTTRIRKAIEEKLTFQRKLNYSELFGTKSKAMIIDRIAEKLLSKANDTFRQQYCISCFSEVFDSEIMWGHYANCAKGFVVAYDGEELKKVAENSNSTFINFLKQLNWLNIDLSDVEKDKLTTLAPVIYSNGKFNFDKEIIEVLEPVFEYYDNLCICKTIADTNGAIHDFFEKINKIGLEKQPSRNYAFYSALCNKSKAWSYEKEWRVWAYNSNQLNGRIDDPHVLIGEINPIALYLGERITSYDERILMAIAKEDLHIPVYKMKTKMFKNSCRLEPELIF